MDPIKLAKDIASHLAPALGTDGSHSPENAAKQHDLDLSADAAAASAGDRVGDREAPPDFDSVDASIAEARARGADVTRISFDQPVITADMLRRLDEST